MDWGLNLNMLEIHAVWDETWTSCFSKHDKCWEVFLNMHIIDKLSCSKKFWLRLHFKGNQYYHVFFLASPDGSVFYICPLLFFKTNIQVQVDYLVAEEASVKICCTMALNGSRQWSQVVDLASQHISWSINNIWLYLQHPKDLLPAFLCQHRKQQDGFNVAVRLIICKAGLAQAYFRFSHLFWTGWLYSSPN